LRFEGKQPGRRAYHTSFINEDKIYVLGGHDIAEGPTDSLWAFDLRKLGDLNDIENHTNEDTNINWIELKTSGIRMPRKFISFIIIYSSHLKPYFGYFQKQNVPLRWQRWTFQQPYFLCA